LVNNHLLFELERNNRLMSRILIVEDEKRIAAFMEKGLQKHGFSTAIATDGEQGLSMAQSDEFDLLLLDLGLPIIDGWTVLKRLRNQGKQVPVIIISARDDLKDKGAELEISSDSYLSKPFSFQDLLSKVRCHLSCFK